MVHLGWRGCADRSRFLSPASRRTRCRLSAISRAVLITAARLQIPDCRRIRGRLVRLGTVVGKVTVRFGALAEVGCARIRPISAAVKRPALHRYNKISHARVKLKFHRSFSGRSGAGDTSPSRSAPRRMEGDRIAIGIGGDEKATEGAVGGWAEDHPATLDNQVVQHVGVGARDPQHHPHPERP